MDTDQADPALASGERFVPGMRGHIRLEHLHRYFIARELARGKVVLDIACGEGYGANLLAEVANRVIGIDVADDVIGRARERYRRRNLDFQVGRCEAIPLKTESVDLIVSFETIEHLHDHQSMMQELKRVLRPGGTLIISSPDRHEYSEIPSHENPFHVRELDREEFDALLKMYYRHVTMVGQRIWVGSFAWMLDSPSAGSNRFEADSAGQPTKGPLVPLYLIAVASNNKPTSLPLSLLDGGSFIWPEDYLDALHDLERQRLAKQSMESELERRVAEVAELDMAKRVLEQKVAALEAAKQENAALFESQLPMMHRRIIELGQVNAQLERSLWTVVEPLQQTATHMQATKIRLADLDKARRAWVATEEYLRTRLNDVEQGRARLAGEIAAMQQSVSWRITAPLRAARTAVREFARSTRNGARRLTSLVYATLSLSLESRLRAKDILFSAAPFLFRSTTAYKGWYAYKQAHEERRRALVPQPSAAFIVGPSATEWIDDEPGRDWVGLRTDPPIASSIKAIAFYLPQFHPIPENDEWWGKGFTEWNNVVRGRPQFHGHYQPHLPGELGFYDLRVPDIQRRQIELARMYGIHGFCYHHYWFGGRRLLRRPLDQLLADSSLDFPFCLCWANENWTRRWDGHEEDVLMAQRHSPDDDLAFIEDIAPALRDPRYIRIGGRPLLIVYRPSLLPDARQTAELWRSYCRRAGLGEPFLISTHAFDQRNPRDLGFDAATEFAPNNLGCPAVTSSVSGVNPQYRGVVYDYEYLVARSRAYEPPADYEIFRCVAPTWDNEARRPNHGKVFVNSSPDRYAEWLENACTYTAAELRRDRPFVFINAWNEWAEGAHLEPDRRYGYAYLQATASVLQKFPKPDRPSLPAPIPVGAQVD